MGWRVRNILSSFAIYNVKVTLWLKRGISICQKLFLGDYGGAIRYSLAYAMRLDCDIYE
jgi:hypothetical protein